MYIIQGNYSLFLAEKPRAGLKKIRTIICELVNVFYGFNRATVNAQPTVRATIGNNEPVVF